MKNNNKQGEDMSKKRMFFLLVTAIFWVSGCEPETDQKGVLFKAQDINMSSELEDETRSLSYSDPAADTGTDLFLTPSVYKIALVNFWLIKDNGTEINLINPAAIPPDPDGVPTGERIFIMATQPNTNVNIDGAFFTTLNNPGEQAVYEIRNNSTHVEGDKPIMVLHVSGFGCEMGGAVLPTVDGCTGSVEVRFSMIEGT